MFTIQRKKNNILQRILFGLSERSSFRFPAVIRNALETPPALQTLHPELWLINSLFTPFFACCCVASPKIMEGKYLIRYSSSFG